MGKEGGLFSKKGFKMLRALGYFWMVSSILFVEATEPQKIQLESIDFRDLVLVKEFRGNQDLPACAKVGDLEYFQKRSRKVYQTKSGDLFLKIWSKDHPSKEIFEKAVFAGFFNEIAKIHSLIYDQEGLCRGYTTPALLSRESDKKAFESYGFFFGKNNLNTKIFERKALQPKMYQDFFTRVCEATKRAGYFLLDFCPCNVGIDLVENRLYFFDLEDVHVLSQITSKTPRVSILLEYNPKDYLEQFGLRSL